MKRYEKALDDEKAWDGFIIWKQIRGIKSDISMDDFIRKNLRPRIEDHCSFIGFDQWKFFERRKKFDSRPEIPKIGKHMEKEEDWLGFFCDLCDQFKEHENWRRHRAKRRAMAREYFDSLMKMRPSKIKR